VVCMDQPQEHAFFPCGHFCVCTLCCGALIARGECPRCRGEITRSQRIYRG
jgi:hypothetical protein